MDAMPLLNAVLDLNIPENDFTQNLEPKIRQSALHALLEDCLKAQATDEPTLIVIEDLQRENELRRTMSRYLSNEVIDRLMVDPDGGLEGSSHEVTILFSDRGLPKSYRHVNGYGSHTYSLINAAGERVAPLPLVDPAKIAAATIVMRGEYDGIASVEDLLAFFARLPNPDKQFAVMPGIAHASFQQKNYRLVYHILASFFAQPEPVYRGD